jgi:hypothetical protein
MKRFAAGAAVLLLLAVAVLALARGDDKPTAVPRTQPAAYTRTCGPGSSVPAARGAGDAVLGPVRLVGFHGEFSRAKAEQIYSPRPGVKGLKAPVVFGGDRDVTISVPRALRGVLALDFASERRGVDTVAEAHPSVRFRACAVVGGGRG